MRIFEKESLSSCLSYSWGKPLVTRQGYHLAQVATNLESKIDEMEMVVGYCRASGLHGTPTKKPGASPGLDGTIGQTS
jgi:hypothetical protein